MIRKLEELSLNAWAPLQTAVYDGWILRFANGFTKRANSVNPIYHSREDIDKKISFCERTYRSKGLNVVFKITGAVMPENLDQQLEEKGYAALDHTSVQTVELTDFQSNFPEGIVSSIETCDWWVSDYCRLSKRTAEEGELTKKMLANITQDKIFVVLQVENRTVACGMGVIEDGYIGIFDIAADEAERRKGYGERVVRSIMQYGKVHGADKAYLQVMLNNPPALKLYEKLGFKEVYKYWYRVKK